MKENSKQLFSTSLLYSRPVLMGFGIFLFFALLSLFILWQHYKIETEANQREMSNIISLVENNIEQSLQNSNSAALSLALLINTEGDVIGFDELAPRLVDGNPNIDAVQMVPAGIITQVYPLLGNEEALNLNILTYPLTREEALRAIETRKMYFAGPIELRQGGRAVIGRLPVFTLNNFWGFAAVIIKLETLMHHSGINELAGDKYQFQFSKIDPDTGEEEVFLPPLPQGSRVYSEAVNLPDGDWRFYIVPQKPLKGFYDLLPLALFMLLLSVFLGWAMTRLLRRPARLQALVELQAGEIHLSELKFRTIFNQAAIGMARVDSNTGKLLETNIRFRQLLGYNEEELKRFNYADITVSEDLEEDFQRLRQLQRGEIREYSHEKRVVRKSKEIFWVKLSISPLWEEGEAPTSHITLVEDINDRKIAELNLKKSYAMVMEQNKRLLNFSYIVSHNLRSHSSNIQSILSLFEETAEEEEKQNYIGMLNTVTNRLSQTLYDLNEVVSIQTNIDLTVAALPVKQYVDQCLALLKLEINRQQAEIEVNIPGEMIVPFNVAYMESVLLNFLTNALRYRHPNRTPQISITGKKEQGGWTLAIEDNGIGIDLDQHRDKLFGLYKTFSGNPNSRGVGLFISRNQIEAMGGRVEVYSTPNEGTTFKIFFK